MTHTIETLTMQRNQKITVNCLPLTWNLDHIDLRSIGKGKATSKEEDHAPTHLCLNQPPSDQGGRVLDLAENLVFIIVIVIEI